MTYVDDEFTPRERGLEAGDRWARWSREHGVVARSDGHAIDPVAAAAQEPPRIAESLRRVIMDAGIRERLDASEDPDAEGAFWAGFRDGVRAYLVEVDVGTAN
jgi:hypothetical protein